MRSIRPHVRSQMAWLALIDLACLLIGCAFGVLVRFGPDELRPYVFNHLDGWLLFVGGVILANYLAGTYRVQYTFSRFNLVVTWLFSLLFTLLILSMTAYAWFMILLGRGVLFLAIFAYSVCALLAKLLLYRSLFRSGGFVCRTAVLGTGRWAQACRRLMEREYVMPVHRIVAFIRVFEDDPKTDKAISGRDGVPVLDGSGGRLEEVVRALGVGLVVLGYADMRGVSALYPQLKRLRFRGVEVLTPLAVAEIYSGASPLELVNEEAIMAASMESGLPMVWRVKRLFDMFMALFAIAAFLPLIVLIGLVIKVSAPRSPVLYSQMRVGRFGVPFRIYKIRTMKVGAESGTGAVWSSRGDPRITRLGRVLRKFRIDEMPQFVNVLLGDMSMVGPRPERPEICSQLARQIPFYEERENMVPGLTGWAQIRHPYGDSIEDAMRKLEYDLYYMKHMSLSLDLQIILSTLRIVVLGKERSV